MRNVFIGLKVANIELELKVKCFSFQKNPRCPGWSRQPLRLSIKGAMVISFSEFPSFCSKIFDKGELL